MDEENGAQDADGLADALPETVHTTAKAVPPGPQPMQRSEIADGLEHPLDPRSVSLQRLVAWITTLVSSLSLLLGLIMLLLLAPIPDWGDALLGGLWVAGSLAMCWSSHFWPRIEHRHTSYRVDSEGIQIRKGVLWRRVINVPRTRVQHTDVSQGPLERSYGLGTLAIYTAGAEFAKVVLHGLEHGRALRIRGHLLPQEVDDAV